MNLKTTPLLNKAVTIVRNMTPNPSSKPEQVITILGPNLSFSLPASMAMAPLRKKVSE